MTETFVKYCIFGIIKTKTYEILAQCNMCIDLFYTDNIHFVGLIIKFLHATKMLTKVVTSFLIHRAFSFFVV
jgi:hypothetical protein